MVVRILRLQAIETQFQLTYTTKQDLLEGLGKLTELNEKLKKQSLKRIRAKHLRGSRAQEEEGSFFSVLTLARFLSRLIGIIKLHSSLTSGTPCPALFRKHYRIPASALKGLSHLGQLLTSLSLSFFMC